MATHLRSRVCRPQKLVQRDAGAPSRQIDGPHVMKRHAGKKVVNPQWQPFELLRRDLWHRASFVVNECYRDVTPTTSQLPSCRPLLDRRIGPTQDSFQEVLGTSGASHADDYWPHTRLGDELECQEGATLPFCHNHFRHNQNPFAIARNAESIPIREFLSLDHSRPKLGKERCFTLV
jgi:hypothetical protein